MCADSNTSQYLPQAEQLLRRVPLIGKAVLRIAWCHPAKISNADGHNDFPFIIRGLYLNAVDNKNLNDLPIGQTDITGLRRGLVGGQFWSAYVPKFVFLS